MSEPAGPSKNMSVEEAARDANKSFWKLSQELEEEEAAAGAASGDHGNDEQDAPEDDDAETTDGAASGGHEDDTTTTNGGDHMNGGGNPTARKQKKERKERTAQVLANVRDHFTEVTPSGLPVAPEALAKGYSMQLGCIVWERDRKSVV